MLLSLSVFNLVIFTTFEGCTSLRLLDLVKVFSLAFIFEAKLVKWM